MEDREHPAKDLQIPPSHRAATAQTETPDVHCAAPSRQGTAKRRSTTKWAFRQVGIPPAEPSQPKQAASHRNAPLERRLVDGQIPVRSAERSGSQKLAPQSARNQNPHRSPATKQALRHGPPHAHAQTLRCEPRVPQSARAGCHRAQPARLLRERATPTVQTSWPPTPAGPQPLAPTTAYR